MKESSPRAETVFFFHGLRIEEYIVLIIIVFDFLEDLKFAVWNRRNGGEGIRFFERIFFSPSFSLSTRNGIILSKNYEMRSIFNFQRF